VSVLWSLNLGGWGTVPQHVHVARMTSLEEVGHLTLIGKHDFTLLERGRVSGTSDGVIYVRLTAVSTSRVIATVKILPRGGGIFGYASASYRNAGPTTSFAGSMSINYGSGIYAGVHGSGLSFSGTIERSNDAITVRVSGRVTG
jgi:hypothetical protein